MNRFLFDTFNKYKRFSERLDVETVLCNKTWFVFNDSGKREIYIFQEKGKLIISLNGKVTHATWEYIPANKSLIISGDEQSYMVHAAYVDNILFALQIDGTKEYAFLIDENNKQDFQPQSYNDIKRYFQIKEQKLLQEQEFERLEDERLLAQKAKKEQEERKKIQREKKVQDLQSKANEIRNINGCLWLFMLLISTTVFVGLLLLALLIPGLRGGANVILFFTILVVWPPFNGIFLWNYITNFIGNKKAEKWKKKHPNDPVNQYL